MLLLNIIVESLAVYVIRFDVMINSCHTLDLPVNREISANTREMYVFDVDCGALWSSVKRLCYVMYMYISSSDARTWLSRIR